MRTLNAALGATLIHGPVGPSVRPSVWPRLTTGRPGPRGDTPSGTRGPAGRLSLPLHGLNMGVWSEARLSTRPQEMEPPAGFHRHPHVRVCDGTPVPLQGTCGLVPSSLGEAYQIPHCPIRAGRIRITEVTAFYPSLYAGCPAQARCFVQPQSMKV